MIPDETLTWCEGVAKQLWAMAETDPHKAALAGMPDPAVAIDALIAEVRRLREAERFVSVGERPPAPAEPVLVHYRKHGSRFVDEGALFERKWTLVADPTKPLDDVLGWRPLPAPPATAGPQTQEKEGGA